ncbi:MAG: glycosyltransferase, partial [Abditibacteriales bacterium]|nr:glycosyltransferase [Abditibacteriales bacterium]
QTVGIPPERITVIYNGVDLDRFETCARRRVGVGDHDASGEGECRPSLPESSTTASRATFHVGCVGTLRPVKGHRYLIEAIAAVREKVPHVHLSLVGDGPARGELDDLRQRLGLNGCVSLLGMRDDVDALLKQFDVFVLPSLSEGISNALLEAMAAGLPVVATDVGGNPEVVQHGVTGLLVPPQDSRALAEALWQLLTDADGRCAMGRKGRERVETYFSLSAMAQRYGEIYEAALQR